MKIISTKIKPEQECSFQKIESNPQWSRSVDFIEGKCLFKYAGKSTNNCVELGSYFGKSSCFLSLALKGTSRTLYCIDRFGQGYNPLYAEKGNFGKQGDFLPLFKRNLKKYGSPSCVKIIRGDVNKNYKEIKNIGFIFVDADHSYEHVKKNIKIWTPKLNNGGYMLFHNVYDKLARGVKKALSELTPKYNLVKIARVHSMAVFQKEEKCKKI